MDSRNSGLNKSQINYTRCATHDGSAFEDGPHTSFAAWPISHFPSSCTSALSNSTSFNCLARLAFCMNRRLRVPVLRVLLAIVMYLQFALNLPAIIWVIPKIPIT